MRPLENKAAQNRTVRIIAVILLWMACGIPAWAQAGACLCLPVTDAADNFFNDGGYYLDTCNAGMPLPSNCNEAYKSLYRRYGLDQEQLRVCATKSWDMRFLGKVLWDSMIVNSWEHPNLPPIDSRGHPLTRSNIRNCVIHSRQCIGIWATCCSRLISLTAITTRQL